MCFVDGEGFWLSSWWLSWTGYLGAPGGGGPRVGGLHLLSAGADVMLSCWPPRTVTSSTQWGTLHQILLVKSSICFHLSWGATGKQPRWFRHTDNWQRDSVLVHFQQENRTTLSRTVFNLHLPIDTFLLVCLPLSFSTGSVSWRSLPSFLQLPFMTTSTQGPPITSIFRQGNSHVASFVAFQSLQSLRTVDNTGAWRDI